ncbi:hypothetical protein ACSMDC_02235 [Yersinia enterocolitica]|uniref:hypothetical protein n=1 Tax=Yersinia enterocolitica TaxID=630 RepID=UPI003F5212D1
MSHFFQQLITKEIVASIDITINWVDKGYESKAAYMLTKTWFGTRSWFLVGDNIWPAQSEEHHLFKYVELWVKNGVIPKCAEKWTN